MTDDEAAKPETWVSLCRMADGILAALDEVTADEDYAVVALQLALGKRMADRCDSRDTIERAAVSMFRGVRQSMIDWYAHRSEPARRPPL